MKVLAIRVAEFGRFREPVALERLSGRLDLVLGPNEAGKSTLFRALRMALMEKHRSTKTEFSEVRPYSGGTPTVEVDFEAGGERWRVRKRFLSERSAELRSLQSGAVARGSDAEDALERLLDLKGAGGRFSMLWLRQGTLLEPHPVNEDGEVVLRSAIEREVASAAGGDAARRVLQRVRAALGELATAQKGQPRGRYRDADSAVARLNEELAQARAALADAEGLLTRLGAVNAALDEREEPSHQAGLRRHLSEAEDRLAAARAANSARDAARIVLADARMTHQAATHAAKVLADGLAELEKLGQAASEDATERRDVEARLEAVEAAYDKADEAAEANRRRLEALQVAARRASAVVRLQELSNRVARWHAVTGRISGLETELRTLPPDEGPIREARALAARIAEAAVRLEAVSTAVTVRYEDGKVGSITTSGRAIADSEKLVAASPIELEIPGIGRIEITPGASGDRVRIERELSANRSALQHLVAISGCGTLNDWEQQHEVARGLASELEAARAEAAGIAPPGSNLEAELKAVAAEVDEAPASCGEMCDPRGLEEQIHRLRNGLEDDRQMCRSLAASREDLRHKLAGLSARDTERERHRTALAGSLPPPEAIAHRRSELDAAAQSASQALDDALRLHAMAAGQAVDPHEVARLEHALADARDAMAMNERAIASLNEERARIEGSLEAVRQEDVAGRVAALEARAERAGAVLEDITDEVQALQLLESELAAEEERMRASYLAPVLDRLGPYFDLVFPNAGLTLGRGYSVDALHRESQAERVAQLSTGTREQIAVLVRLAFARLLADQGLTAPLVLDDALVYSDDRRIAAMQRALEAAGHVHQVIVLSCREQSFAGLRGHRCELVPWQPV
ncbi:MAG: AAA family ATPase [Hyphomicrobiaceae bacterium]